MASVSGALFTGLAVVGLMSYAPSFLQGALGLSELGSAAVLATWSATSTIVALAARSLPTWIGTETRLAAGLVLAALGEVALASLDSGTGWTRLVPGLIVLGVGTGVANAALGRIAVESVPHGRAALGSGANNTARYLAGAARSKNPRASISSTTLIAGMASSRMPSPDAHARRGKTGAAAGTRRAQTTFSATITAWPPRRTLSA